MQIVNLAQKKKNEDEFTIEEGKKKFLKFGVCTFEMKVQLQSRLIYYFNQCNRCKYNGIFFFKQRSDMFFLHNFKQFFWAKLSFFLRLSRKALMANYEQHKEENEPYRHRLQPARSPVILLLVATTLPTF